LPNSSPIVESDIEGVI